MFVGSDIGQNARYTPEIYKTAMFVGTDIDQNARYRPEHI